MSLELWGGIESTISRIQDTYSSQIIRSGHYNRLSDLDLIASLGIKKIRYPVLWEMCDDDLSWAEERLNKLKDLGIEPIVGLLHHGSGPKYTNLLDDKFPELLARYAERVAKKFPWVKYYTPVNEPVTTARFSALYGVWYPHKSDPVSFGKALINQSRGTILSMEAIRNINPDACLVQTEDLGKVYATPNLQYQAEHENERRWLGFDLLTGNIATTGLMYQYMLDIGFNESDFLFLSDHGDKNTILGFDSYLTSVRYLDEQIDLYPEHMHGGNGNDRYVDTEAIRAFRDVPSIDHLLMEAWDRYHLPMAITESHVNGNDRERIKWFVDFWNGALLAKQQGADIRAVTSWGLFGLYDWDKLLAAPGVYEAGAFRVSEGEVFETELCDVLRKLAKGEDFQADYNCWWHEDARFIYASP